MRIMKVSLIQVLHYYGILTKKFRNAYEYEYFINIPSMLLMKW